MVARVRDDQRAVRRERGHGGEIGRVAGGEDERGLEAAEVRELAFELPMKFGRAGDEPRAGRTGAPAARGLGGGRRDLGVVGQPEVVVARQIEKG